VSYRFAGSYENQVRASARLRWMVPAALLLIFVLLQLLFRSVALSSMVFAGVFVAWAGGFWLVWLYGQPWFLDLAFLGADLRQLFNVHTVNLSVAVWVGFLALFGIATDNGVVLGTRLRQAFADGLPESIARIHESVEAAGMLRLRACLMSTATTVLALLPVLTSTGKGADVMVPMAIPTFGGMAAGLLTLLLVPVLYSAAAEARWWLRSVGSSGDAPSGPSGDALAVSGASAGVDAAEASRREL
jgi:Cu(I)/Ag(I) efflux system membrane protein CusA/SilA